jgi:hypothetical protein
VNRRAFGRALAAFAASAGALHAGRASAEPLTKVERDLLGGGRCVKRPVDADLEAGTYIGGVSYCVAEAPAPFVLAMLANVSIYKRILALTLEASPVGKKGADQLVYFKHGGDLGTAGYTMRVSPADSHGVIRFWMDPAYDHEIEDVWGFVRAEPLGPSSCLVTYGVLCDLGTVIRLVFGERIRDFALDTPEHVRWVAAERYFAPKMPVEH